MLLLCPVLIGYRPLWDDQNDNMSLTCFTNKKVIQQRKNYFKLVYDKELKQNVCHRGFSGFFVDDPLKYNY